MMISGSKLFLSMLLLLLLLLLGLEVSSSQPSCADLEGRDPPFCLGQATPCEDLCYFDCFATDGCTPEGLVVGACRGTVASSCNERDYGIDCDLLDGCTSYLQLPCDLDAYQNCSKCQQQQQPDNPTAAPTIIVTSSSSREPTASTQSKPSTTSSSTQSKPSTTSSTQTTSSVPPVPFIKASETNFCYNLDGSPPYCYGTAIDCPNLDVIACDVTPGCSSDMSFVGLAQSLSSGNANCAGSITETCSDHSYGPSCESLKGCQSEYDPPCDKDPFDIAITPLDENSLLCGGYHQSSNGGEEVQGACVKSRPSADGDVTIYLEVGASSASGGSYSRCVVEIDGANCQSCSICNVGLTASFNCANLLLRDSRVERDNRCGGVNSRCVGRDCDGNCICGSGTSFVGGLPSSAHKPLTKISWVAAIIFVIVSLLLF